MPYSAQEIKESPNPYLLLKTSDALAVHSEELDKLTAEEMKEVASRIILDCPDRRLNRFGQSLNALHVSILKPSKFYSIIRQAYDVKKCLLALTSLASSCPHTYFLGKEINKDRFKLFNKMALEIIQDKEVSIACRLAITTPKTHREALNKNIGSLFPESALAATVTEALQTRNEIDLLLGEHPEAFFLSSFFSVSLYHKFFALFSSLLLGKEEAIGKKLSTLDAKVRNYIDYKLGKLINSVLTPQSIENIKIAMHANPVPMNTVLNHSFFHSGKTTVPDEKEANPYLNV